MNTMMKINLAKIATIVVASVVIVAGLGAPLPCAALIGFFGGSWLDY
jgi:hypothetical protein